jgi:hypothetical protein
MPRSVLVVGSPEEQRPDERVAYQVTIDATYTSPASPISVLYDLTDDTNVSATKLSGSPAIVGQVFTSPLVIALVANHVYRLEFQFVSGGNTFEPYLKITGIT